MRADATKGNSPSAEIKEFVDDADQVWGGKNHALYMKTANIMVNDVYVTGADKTPQEIGEGFMQRCSANQ